MKFWLRIAIGGMLCLFLAVFALWFFRLPLLIAALRSAGVEEPGIESLEYFWPDTLQVVNLSGRAESLHFSLEDGSAKISGWHLLGDDLHLKLKGAKLVLPESFAGSDVETAKDGESKDTGVDEPFSPFSSLPAFAVTLEDIAVFPPMDDEPWAVFSGALSGGVSRELNLTAETILGEWALESRIRVDSGSGQLDWESAESPDWNLILPDLRRWGVAIPEDLQVGWTDLKASFDVNWDEESSSWSLQGESESLAYARNDVNVSVISLKSDLKGDLPFRSDSVGGGLTADSLRMEIDEDWLEFESMEGSIKPAATGSDLHLTLDGGQASFSEISIQAIAAEVALNRDEEGRIDSTATGSAEAFSGSIKAEVEAQLVPSLSVRATIRLSGVSVGGINERFQFFDGEIEAIVQGKVQAKWEDDELTILASTLEMVPGTEGTLRYENDGWMTGDPQLDVEALSRKLRIDQLLTRADSGGILVELAARNLTVTRLKIALFEEDLKDREGEINLEGFSMVQKTKIPIVLTIPLRGDLQESIRLLMQAGKMM